MRSFSSQLTAVWVAITLACVGLTGVMVGLYSRTATVQVDSAKKLVQTECSLIGSRYAGAADSARQGIHATELASVVLQLVLQDAEGVEGGVFDPARGMVGYSYPTYEGSGIKTDVPDVERPNIEATAAKALALGHSTVYSRTGQREVVLLAACPMGNGWAAWTLTRVPKAQAGTLGVLLAGLATLSGVVLLTAVGLAAIIRRWRRKLAAVGLALSAAEGVPDIPNTGAPEVDRLSAAVVQYATRLEIARHERAVVDDELRRHERLVTLGRMTATVAHEIRNPIATMRLAAENAMVMRPDGENPPYHDSLKTVLVQVDRLNGVVESLLTMVQPVRLTLSWVQLVPWVASIIDETPWPRMFNVETRHLGRPSWRMDPRQIQRVVENLLRNAMDHTTQDGQIALDIATSDDQLRITVENEGPDVHPDVVGHLFEPFASGRINGNGLGLALVMDIAQAHGGIAGYARVGDMTQFFIELPWHVS